MWGYNSAVNYDTAHSEVTYTYFYKVFYNRTNKKKYNLQIEQHNVCHTNIVVMKDMIIKEKVREKEKLSKDITDTTAPSEVAQKSSPVNLAIKYMQAMSNANLDATKELELTSIKKY